MTGLPLAIGLALAAAGVAAAHTPPRTQRRDIVRLVGRRSADAPAPAGRMELRVLGAAQPFATTAREAYSLAPDEGAEAASHYALQGPRALLARVANARPAQTVSILAEHHPGSEDLFLLAVDLCPPE